MDRQANGQPPTALHTAFAQTQRKSSEAVGYGWTVLATCRAVRPCWMARQASPTIVLPRAQMKCAPRSTPVFASATTLAKPSVWPFVRNQSSAAS